MSITSNSTIQSLSLYLKIEYKQIVYIKTIATEKFLRESALPTGNTLKPTKQAQKFSNLEVVGIETKRKCKWHPELC